MCKQFDISNYSWYIDFKKENNYNISIEINKIHKFLVLKGGFHLHFLVFPFVYQFHSRIEALVDSSKE